MKYLSVCSGIEAATVAWHPIGWTPVAFAETEAFPSAVLKHHYPEVPNLGDITKHHEWNHSGIDLLVGGTPCQAFSVAGLRKGLEDPRGNLTLVFLGILARTRPRWMVWENVPGVLSDSTGAFASFLGGLAELGYGFAYRILDAQYFGLAQRRKRVFVVGCLGDWKRAAAVLFERESLRGDSPPSRETRERIAPTISARTQGGGGLGTDFDLDGGVIASGIDGGDVGFAIRSNASHSGDKGDGGVNTTMVIAPLTRNPYGDNDGRESMLVPSLVSNCDAHSGFRDEHGLIPTVAGTHMASYANTSDKCRGESFNLVAQVMAHGQSGAETVSDGSPSLTCNHEAPIGFIPSGKAMAVRRLAPRECERLQGFPDDYTIVPYRGKPTCDGPRYKALGNSMAVPVMRWIGKRIDSLK